MEKLPSKKAHDYADQTPALTLKMPIHSTPTQKPVSVVCRSLTFVTDPNICRCCAHFLSVDKTKIQ